MSLYDLIIIGILLLSTGAALMRGVVTELASLAAWILAFWGAKILSPVVAPIALATVEPAALRNTVAFILLFFLLLAAQYFLRTLLTELIKAIGLNGVNKLLGGAFGFARGILIVTVMIVICSLTSLPQEPEWQQSVTIPLFKSIALMGAPYMLEADADVLAYSNQ